MHTRTVFASLLLAALAGCGDATAPKSSSAAEDTIAGQVITDQGPVTKAKIEAKDSRGSVVARTEISGDAHYRLTIPAGAAYPLVLTAYPEGQPEPLKAAVTSELAEDQDISEVTSIVVDTAMNLGGLTEANLAKAAGAAISQRKTTGGSGGSAGFKGDPTKNYGGWH
jgi:hypothetical protein